MHRGRGRTGRTTTRRSAVDSRGRSDHRAYPTGTVPQVPRSQSEPDRRTGRVGSNSVPVGNLSTRQDTDQQARKPRTAEALVPSDVVCRSLQPQRESTSPTTEGERQTGQGRSNRCGEEVAPHLSCHLQDWRRIPRSEPTTSSPGTRKQLSPSELPLTDSIQHLIPRSSEQHFSFGVVKVGPEPEWRLPPPQPAYQASCSTASLMAPVRPGLLLHCLLTQMLFSLGATADSRNPCVTPLPRVFNVPLSRIDAPSRERRSGRVRRPQWR